MARVVPFTRNNYTFTTPHASADCAGNIVPHIESQGGIPCDSRAEDFAYLAEAAAERLEFAEHFLDGSHSSVTRTAGACYTDPSRAHLAALKDALDLSASASLPAGYGFNYLSAMPSSASYNKATTQDADYFPFSCAAAGYNTFGTQFPSCDLSLDDVKALYARLGTLKHLVVPCQPNVECTYASTDYAGQTYTEQRSYSGGAVGCAWYYDSHQDLYYGEDDTAVTLWTPVSDFFYIHSGRSIVCWFFGSAHVYWYGLPDNYWTKTAEYDFGFNMDGAVTLRNGSRVAQVSSYPSIRNLMDGIFQRHNITRTTFEGGVVCSLQFSHIVVATDFFHTGL